MINNQIHFTPPVIAHRGASAYAPENTMAAFTKAAQLGIQWIEFDVMLAACGTPIVFHDDTLERTTNGYGSVAEYPYAYLQTLDAGKWFSPSFSGEKIPALVQVLEFMRDYGISANIEIKPLPGQDKITTVRVWEEVSRQQADLSTILFSSFSIKSLETLRPLSDNCMMGLLMDHWLPDWPLITDDLNCVSVHLNQAVISSEKAKKITNSNRKLLCYTVNDIGRAKELYSFGVDAVFSDRPDKVY